MLDFKFKSILDKMKDEHTFMGCHTADYQFIYITKSIKMILSKETFSLVAGDILCFRPNMNYSFLTNENSLPFYQIKFDTNYQSELMDKIPTVIRLKNGYMFKQYFDKLFFEEIKDNRYQYDMQNAVFQEYMILLLRELESAKNTKKTNYASMLEELKKYVMDHIDENITLDQLSEYMHISKWHLLRIFNTYYEITPIKFISSLRIERAKELIIYSKESILDISKKMSFDSQQSFTRWFKSVDGHTPTYYRKKQSK